MKTTFDPNNLIRITTAARLKEVERQSIYYHIKSGHLTKTKIDGVIFVLRDEVERLEIRKPNTTQLFRLSE